MKKSLLLIPLVLLGLWAGSTWIIGSYTQNGFSSALEEVNSNLGPKTGVTSLIEESYSRGFLSSKAIAKIAFASKNAAEKKEAFLKLQVWHGPLMMTPEGFKIGAEYALVTLDKDRLPEKTRKILNAGFKGAEPLKLGLFTGFGGKVSIDTEIAPFSSPEEEPNTLNFEGLTLNLQTNINSSFANGKLKFGALNYEDKKAGNLLSIAAAESEMDYKDVILKVAANGTSHIDFPEIKLKSKQGSYELSDLHFESSSKKSDGKLKVSSKIGVGEFKGTGQGKHAETLAKMNGKLNLEFSAEGMDIETLQLMADAQKDLQKAQQGKSENSKTKEQATHDYLIAASSLLQPGYKMKNLIVFTNKSGKSELGLGLEYTGKKPLFELASIRELIAALEVAINLQVVKDLIPAPSAEKIKPAVGMGFILDRGELYKGDAILAGGELTVNGKPQPILKNMGPMLDLPIPWEKLGIKKAK